MQYRFWLLFRLLYLVYCGIFNYPPASKQYNWNRGSAYAIPPNPPASTNTITGEPIFVQSYINAYNTAFNQKTLGFKLNYQKALYRYNKFAYSDVNSDFVNGTFGYEETYNTLSQRFYINYLQDDANYYDRNTYLFISAGSGGGSGYMYLDWVIVTYGVPYAESVS